MANRSDEELNEETSEWREPYPAAIDTPPRASLPPPRLSRLTLKSYV